MHVMAGAVGLKSDRQRAKRVPLWLSWTTSQRSTRLCLWIVLSVCKRRSLASRRKSSSWKITSSSWWRRSAKRPSEWTGSRNRWEELNNLNFWPQDAETFFVFYLIRKTYEIWLHFNVSLLRHHTSILMMCDYFSCSCQYKHVHLITSCLSHAARTYSRRTSLSGGCILWIPNYQYRAVLITLFYVEVKPWCGLWTSATS